MSETLEYIDSYFSGQLNQEEKSAFEKRCLDDQTFAEEVAFYVSARAGLRAELNDEKKKDFEQLYYQSRPQQRSRVVPFLKPLLAIAAACILAFITWQLFLYTPAPDKLASNYIDENLSTLSVKMSGTADSLQSGLEAYNKKDYAKAESVFKNISHGSNVSSIEATRYLGIVYLVTDRYTEAISQFDKLSSYSNLHSNPGLFYKAVTLLKRSEAGDREAAKLLLQSVVDGNLYGSREAARWLDDL